MKKPLSRQGLVVAFPLLVMFALLSCAPVTTSPAPTEPTWSFYPSPRGAFESRVPVTASAGPGWSVYRSVSTDPRTTGTLQAGPFWLGSRGTWSLNWAVSTDRGWSSVKSTTYRVEPQRPQAAAGADHSLVLQSDTLWAWGQGINGQLAQGEIRPEFQGSRVAVGHLKPILAVWAAGDNTAFLDEEGDLWVCGFGPWVSSQESGLSRVGTPLRVPLPAGTRVQTAAIAWSGDVWAVDTKGRLWVWGPATSHALGTGTDGMVSTPRVVLEGVTLVAAGTYHALALKANGSLWVTGRHHDTGFGGLDEFNRLGTGSSSADQTGWVTIGTWTDGFALGASENHSWVLTGTGELWVWGYNGFGQLPGVESQTTRVDAPTLVRTHVATVASGARSLILVPESGTLEIYGQGPSPVPSIPPPIRSLKIGGFHALALLEGFREDAPDPWAALVFWGTQNSGS